VRAHRDMTPTVREFEIRPEGGVKPWSVGSHIELQVVVDGAMQTRSYSLVGTPQADGANEVYRIAVRRAEPGRGGSRWMWSLETGTELLISEPENRFALSYGAPHTLLVAGGIGITPILGMALTLARRGSLMRMCYAARSATDFAYGAELRAALGDRLATFDGANGQRLDLGREFAALPPKAQAWVCGPLRLLDAAREAWAAAGRSAAGLHIETFGNSGHFDAEAFWCEVPRHGIRVVVPPERSLLDVLAEAGVEALSDCRRGECGLCAMDIVRTEGTIDHRDVFLGGSEKRTNQRLCACVSRVRGGGVVLDSAYRPDT